MSWVCLPLKPAGVPPDHPVQETRLGAAARPHPGQDLDLEVELEEAVEKIEAVPVLKTNEAPPIQKTQKPITAPQIQTGDGFVDVPIQRAIQVPQARRRSLISRQRRSR